MKLTLVVSDGVQALDVAGPLDVIVLLCMLTVSVAVLAIHTLYALTTGRILTAGGAGMLNAPLILSPNLGDYDGFNDVLTESHHALDGGQNKMLNAQLILQRSNHIGDMPVLRDAFALARANVERTLVR